METCSRWFLYEVLFQTYYGDYYFVWQREHSDFCLNVKVIFFVSVQLLELIFQCGVKHNFYSLCVKYSGIIKGIHKLSCVTWHFTSSWCRCIYIAKYILVVIKTVLSNKRKKKLLIRTADETVNYMKYFLHPLCFFNSTFMSYGSILCSLPDITVLHCYSVWWILLENVCCWYRWC